MSAKVISEVGTAGKARSQECAPHRDAMGAFGRFVKRAMDIVGAFAGMLLFSPLYLVVYCAIKMEDKGPAIFSQERVGYRGRTFIIYKFRSMVMQAEKDGKPELCAVKDDRITKVGRFLREHHLDELPQLWNVLKGDMSMVGPRPERRYFVDLIMEKNPDYRYLYQLRPGLFSKATLYNGYANTLDKMLERLRIDLEYLDNRSIWMDTKIIFLTVTSILTGKKF